MKVLVTSCLGLALFLVLASKVSTSVLIGLMLSVGMISCVLIMYFASQKKPKLPENYRLDKPSPIVSFELRFILFLVGNQSLFYLPNGQLVSGNDVDLHKTARKVFLKNPELFVKEREAGRLLRSEREMPPVLPGKFKMQMTFRFHYQPALTENGEMISPFELEPGKQFKTTDYKRLISSVQSILKSRPELIGQELRSGRLTPVTPLVEKNM